MTTALAKVKAKLRGVEPQRWPGVNSDYVTSKPRLMPSGAVEIDGSALFDLATLHEQMAKQSRSTR